MPNDYVDTIQKGETQYPVKDSRLPDATSEDSGKVLKVDTDGAYALGEAGGGGGGVQLYLHSVTTESVAEYYPALVYIISTNATPLTYSDLNKAMPSKRRALGIVSIFSAQTDSNPATVMFLYDGVGPGASYGTLCNVEFSYNSTGSTATIARAQPVFSSGDTIVDTVTAI